MILSSNLPGLLAEVAAARGLVAQIARLRAMPAGAQLEISPGKAPPAQPTVIHTGPGETELVEPVPAMPLGLHMPVGMVVEGLVKQLRQIVTNLRAGGIVFDEAEAMDLPPAPVKRGRKAAAA